MPHQQPQIRSPIYMQSKDNSKVIMGHAAETTQPAMKVTSNTSAVASATSKQGDQKTSISQEKRRPATLVDIVPTGRVGTGTGIQGLALTFDIGLLNSPTALQDLMADARTAAKSKP